MVKKSIGTSSSEVASQLPPDEALIRKLLKESISQNNINTSSSQQQLIGLNREDHSNDTDENNTLCMEALQALLSSSSSSNTNITQIEQTYTKVFERLHNANVLSSKPQVKQLIESIPKETLEKCVKYLHSQASRLSSDKVNVMALRFHEILIHLTLIGKAGDMLRTNVVEEWIQPMIKLYVNNNKTETSKELLTYVSQGLRFLIQLIGSYREIVHYIANLTNYTNRRIAYENKLKKENKKENPLKKRAQEKALDAEEKMFQEMEKLEEDSSLNNDTEIDEYFDENENPGLLENKKHVFNKPLLQLVIEAGEKNIQNLSNLSEDCDTDLEMGYHYISKLVMQALIEIMDISLSQVRFEEISSVVCELGVPFLNNFIDYYFEKDRSMLEKALLLIACFISNDKLVPTICKSVLFEKTVNLYKKYVVKGEEGSKFSSYICSLCCYIIGRSAIKDHDSATLIINKYIKPNDHALLVSIINNVIKNNRNVLLKHMTYAGYTAVQGILATEGTTELIVEVNRQTDLIDTLIKDIKFNREKLDPYLADIKYHSMVLLKVICNNLVIAKNSGTESLKQQVAPMLEKILDSGVVQSMFDVITKDVDKKNKKKDKEDKPTMKDFLFGRYTKPGAISSLTAVFQSCGKSQDDTVLKKLMELITSDQTYYQLFHYFNKIETFKHQKTMSPKTIFFIIVVFAVFLISLPLLFKLFK
ncbi:hypothetical protein FDP41_005233 [Naegleria fowleri]|uniref:Uncharacterized protein n=1 Tax=Naegleria fowleri TaxID=5763 RepID=A0A6A5BLY6_NAEFO|nr:uncharacterized protein FDP41_005233 [Naegleria fowleri]KAF0975906.1 hypothetical protein FDP41_005233 [Naegleria fowleri]CAG4710200.1 unnamed protein product [Naegleria fowleri]